jgi:hypothetical protein
MLAHRRQQLGIEPISQRERFGQHPAVDRQIQVVDRLSQTLQDAADLPGHD